MSVSEEFQEMDKFFNSGRFRLVFPMLIYPIEGSKHNQPN
jgi:hypothetical protein